MKADRLALLLAGALFATSSAAPAQAPAYEINAIVPLGGPSAAVGHDYQIALDIYEKLVNRTGGIRGRSVHFTLSDDGSDPRVAVQLATQIIAKHPAVILGPASVGTCSAVAPLTDNGPVMYCLSPGFNPKRDSYDFASSVSTEYLVPMMVKYARLRGLTKIALLTASDASGLAANKIAEAAIADPSNHALRTVADERFAPTDINVAAQIARIKAGQPDAIYVWAVGGAFPTALRALRDAGLADTVVLTNNANANVDQLKKYSEFMPKELLLPALRYQSGTRLRPGPLKDATTQFFDAFRAGGIEPSALSVYAWDPARIVVEALRVLGPDASPAQLRSYLSSLHGFVGLNGVYDFRNGDQHGLTDTAAIMAAWNPKAGTFDPISEAGGNPLASRTGSR